MKPKLTLALRLLLGLVFTLAGITGLAHLAEPPPDLPANLKLFNEAMMVSHQFYLVKTCETLAGLLLLSGFFVPLALCILAPIVINITLVNFMMPQGLPLAFIIGAILIYLAFFVEPYASRIRPLFKMK